MFQNKIEYKVSEYKNMQKILNIGLANNIISDAIGLSLFNEMDGSKFYESNKKKLQRIREIDITKISNSDLDHYDEFISKINNWSEWAAENGYLKGFQQTAMSDFYNILFEAACCNISLDKNMTEHFFCYALAKTLFLQIKEYMQAYPKESKYDAMYNMLAAFDFFGDDERYKKDFSPIASSFALLNSWVKDKNMLIKYWEDKIAETGKRENPPNLKSYLNKWKKGVTPSWKIVKLFFDNDLCPPNDFFPDIENLQKYGYRAFKNNLFMAFIITNLFDSLEKQGIVSKSMRTMMRNGTKMYFRDFYFIRNKNDDEYSPNFEKESKNNLMFRTLFCILDGTLGEVSTKDFLKTVYNNPDFPILLDSEEDSKMDNEGLSILNVFVAALNEKKDLSNPMELAEFMKTYPLMDIYKEYHSNLAKKNDDESNINSLLFMNLLFQEYVSYISINQDEINESHQFRLGAIVKISFRVIEIIDENLALLRNGYGISVISNLRLLLESYAISKYLMDSPDIESDKFQDFGIVQESRIRNTDPRIQLGKKGYSDDFFNSKSDFAWISDTTIETPADLINRLEIEDIKYWYKFYCKYAHASPYSCEQVQIMNQNSAGKDNAYMPIPMNDLIQQNKFYIALFIELLADNFILNKTNCGRFKEISRLIHNFKQEQESCA